MFKTRFALAFAAALMAGAVLAQDADPDAQTEVQGPAPAAADLPVNTRFGAWTLSCQAISVSRNVCRLVQEQVLRDSNTLVARLIALPAPDGGAALFAQLPMGVYLPGGAVYRPEADEAAEQSEMVWQRCLGDICEAAIALDAAAVEALDTAGSILFGYTVDPQSEPIVTRVETSELKAGLDALRDGE